jgi:3-dehydroquinate dehydratase/shikimate dehydrogenase
MKQQPMIALCMGNCGLMSRVLAPKFGGFATFATIDGHEATADGQPTVHDLRVTYNFDTINQETKVFGIIGENTEHSTSPAFHNAAFAAGGINATYLPLPIPSGWEHLKATTLSLLHDTKLDFSGASITIPHKEHMLKLVEEEQGNIPVECKKIGAVNTLLRESVLMATNTDAKAIGTLLQTPKRVLVLGAGGVARAAVYASLQLGATVCIVARRTEQAASLADEFDCDSGVESCNNIDTIINCTPVGMKDGPDAEGDPLLGLAPKIQLTSEMTIFDTVYIPEETPLLARARAAHCSVISGSEMFRKQAASQQLFWSTNHNLQN